MSNNFLFAQLQPFTLYGAGSSISDTTITLTSFKTIDGVSLDMYSFGAIGFGTLEPGNGTKEEQISFSGITQNGNGTATLTGVKTVLFVSPYTQTDGLIKSHVGGSQFVISNTAGFYDRLTGKDDDETITGVWTFTNPNYPRMDEVSDPPTDNEQLASKKYVDDVATFGAPLASDSTIGISKLTAAPTDPLTPIAVGENDVKVSPVSLATLTANEVAALAGTGTPNGTTGKYVTRDTLTSEEAAFELLANKDTTVTLGTSDTKYPSQNAVKTYVDNKYIPWTYISSASMTPGGSGTITIPTNANFAIVTYSGSATGSLASVGSFVIAKTGATTVSQYDYGASSSFYMAVTAVWSTSIGISFTTSGTNPTGSATAYFYT